MSVQVSSTIKVQKVTNSKIAEVDFSNLQFGKIFTDHMFVCDYKDGKWLQSLKLCLTVL